MRRAIRSAGAKLIFLPPYSPDLNPIEQAFSQLKTLLRKENARTQTQTTSCIGKLLDQVTAVASANLFQRGRLLNLKLSRSKGIMQEPDLKPTVIMPDTAPLIHLAAGKALHVLNALGLVVVVDIVMLEATVYRDKPFATDVLGWIDPGRQQVYENGRVPAMLARDGVLATVAVLTTRNLLALAEQKGIVQDAESTWSDIVREITTANSGVGAQFHSTGKSMTATVHPVIRRYADGEISAHHAAGLLGDQATVGDVNA